MNNKEIRKKIKAGLRKHWGRSPYKVIAEELGVTATYVRMVVSGTRNSDRVLEKAAEVLKRFEEEVASTNSRLEEIMQDIEQLALT